MVHTLLTGSTIDQKIVETAPAKRKFQKMVTQGKIQKNGHIPSELDKVVNGKSGQLVIGSENCTQYSKKNAF